MLNTESLIISDKMISLNVGGQWYTTTWSTLNRFDSEALQQMLCNPNEDGNFNLIGMEKCSGTYLGF